MTRRRSTSRSSPSSAKAGVWRGGEADDFQQATFDFVQLRQKGALHAAVAAPEQVRLIDQHQVATLDLIGVAVDALNPGKQDRRADVTARQARLVNARWRLGRRAQHRHKVVLDQLLHVREDQYAGVA